MQQEMLLGQVHITWWYIWIERIFRIIYQGTLDQGIWIKRIIWIKQTFWIRGTSVKGTSGSSYRVDHLDQVELLIKWNWSVDWVKRIFWSSGLDHLVLTDLLDQSGRSGHLTRYI
jgi:hypothetical protein